MTQVHDPSFIGFHGEPVTGRVPPIMKVEGGVSLTPQQLAGVSHAYKLFRDALRVSEAAYLVQNRVLQDGTKVRMVSNSGLDVVMVWPPGGGPEEAKIPHGFAVVTTWASPLIYKFRPASNTWATDKRWPVSQIPKTPKEVTGYNQDLRAATALVLPLVYDKDDRQLWDYAPHKGPAGTADYQVPICIEYPVSGTPTLAPHRAHIAKNATVAALDGTVLYTMPPPSALGTEAVQNLPGASDVTGTRAVLQAFRSNPLAPSSPVSRYRFKHEVIKRTAQDTYAMDSTNTVDFDAPIGPNTVVSSNVTSTELGESPDGKVYLKAYGTTASSKTVPQPPFTPSGGWADPFNSAGGYYNCGTTISTSNAVIGMDAYVNTKTLTAGTPDSINKVLALPAVSGVEYLQLYRDMAYPGTEYWRGGRKQWAYTGTTPGANSSYVATTSLTKIRRDVDKSLSGLPEFTAMLPWVDVKILEGSVAGALAGSLYQDVTTDAKQFGGAFGQKYLIADPTAPGGTAQDQYNAWEAATNLLGPWNADFAAVPDSGNHTTTVRDIPLRNTGSYTFKSRHFIDYDHRGRFYAAIRVEVVCSGAQWDQAPAGYLGQLAVTSNPSYDVKIYFECKWADAALASTLLASGTCTRPAFEFIPQVAAINVFVYPDSDSERKLNYWIPPQPSIPLDSIDCLSAIAKHQGVNPNLALQDKLTADFDPLKSTEGIEFSYIKHGREIPHKRFVQGQLYARSFKLADLSKALWLLSTLKCDAHQYDNPAIGASWFYMPALGSTIANDKMHVEVRNGVIGTWSDNIPASSGAPLPALGDRNIKLYSV